MKQIMYFLLIFPTISLFAHPNEIKLNVEQIVSLHIEAIGGVKAHKQNITRKSQGTVKFGKAQPSNITIIQKAPHLKYSKISLGTLGDITEGYDGKYAWKKNLKEITVFSGEVLKSKVQDARFHSNIELIMSNSMVYEGKKTENGKKFHVLKDFYRQGLIFIYLDQETYLIHKMIIPSTANIKNTSLTIEMSDYQYVDGIQLPFKIEMIANKKPFMTIKFNKVEHNIEIDDKIFSIPVD